MNLSLEVSPNIVQSLITSYQRKEKESWRNVIFCHLQTFPNPIMICHRYCPNIIGLFYLIFVRNSLVHCKLMKIRETLVTQLFPFGPSHFNLLLWHLCTESDASLTMDARVLWGVVLVVRLRLKMFSSANFVEYPSVKLQVNNLTIFITSLFQPSLKKAVGMFLSLISHNLARKSISEVYFFWVLCICAALSWSVACDSNTNPPYLVGLQGRRSSRQAGGQNTLWSIGTEQKIDNMRLSNLRACWNFF